MKNYIVLFLISLFAFDGVGQDSLLLMSGRKIALNINLIEKDAIHFSFENKRGKVKEGFFMKDEVFSYTKRYEKETIVYVQDKANGDIYTPEEHRFYIHGEQDARDGYETKWTNIVGFTSGVGASLLIGSSAKTFVYPLAYSFGTQMPFIKIRQKSISNPEFKNHESYRRGYEKTARSKKFVSALVSSFSGIAVGIAINELSD